MAPGEAMDVEVDVDNLEKVQNVIDIYLVMSNTMDVVF